MPTTRITPSAHPSARALCGAGKSTSRCTEGGLSKNVFCFIFVNFTAVYDTILWITYQNSTQSLTPPNQDKLDVAHATGAGGVIMGLVVCPTSKITEETRQKKDHQFHVKTARPEIKSQRVFFSRPLAPLGRKRTPHEVGVHPLRKPL